MMVHKLCNRHRHWFCRSPNLGLLTYESIILPAQLMVNQLYSVLRYPRFTICFTPRFLKIPYSSNDGNISKISPLKRLPLVYKVSMWYLREFCVATDPGDEVEILCEAIRVTSKWRKAVKVKCFLYYFP